MNYSDFKIKLNNEYNTFIFNNREIKVLKYLPIEEKFDLIMIALQKSVVNGIYNPIKLDTFFKLNIIYLYTDILFSVDDRADEGALYDEFKCSGLLEEIMNNMEQSEMTELTRYLNECLNLEKTYRNSAAAIISKLVDDLPKNAEAANEIVKNFDKDKYSEVLELAKKLGNK